MPVSLVTNIGSLVAANALNQNQQELNTSIAQLSTGKRIVSAQTDPGGLAISTVMQGLLGGLNQASANVVNAQAYLQTADGALSNIASLLQTAQQLSTEAADGSYNANQLTSIDAQYQGILSTINQIANGATFNGISLFSGNAVTFQVGATNTANDQISVTLPSVTTTTLGVNGSSLTTQANAQAAITLVASALQTIAGDRDTVGSTEQQLSAIANNLTTGEQNLTSALSNIQDANVATTYAAFSQQSVLEQATVQVLRTADQQPSTLVALFQ